MVPDATNQLTSDHGWDTIANRDYLIETIALFKDHGIRTSIFVDADMKMVKAAKATGTDRIELYTESYARNYAANAEYAVEPFTQAALIATDCGLGINAGHDLSRDNLAFFAAHVPGLVEVSIGHALVCDALYFGMENTIMMYKRALQI